MCEVYLTVPTPANSTDLHVARGCVHGGHSSEELQGVCDLKCSAEGLVQVLLATIEILQVHQGDPDVQFFLLFPVTHAGLLMHSLGWHSVGISYNVLVTVGMLTTASMWIKDSAVSGHQLCAGFCCVQTSSMCRILLCLDISYVQDPAVFRHQVCAGFCCVQTSAMCRILLCLDIKYVQDSAVFRHQLCAGSCCV